MSGQTQKQIQREAGKADEKLVVEAGQDKKNIRVRYTRLGSAQVVDLEVDASLTLDDVLKSKGASGRGEVRVKRDGVAITLNRTDKLQEGDTILYIPNAIQGGRYFIGELAA